MSDKMWTQENEKELIRLATDGVTLNKDIAKKFGKSPHLISWKLKRLGIKNTASKKIKGKWNSKHAHLREEVMTYFLTHSKEECMKKFKLKESEIKSLFTVGYRIPSLKHLRKETRTHARFSAKDFQFLLQHSGFMPRDWIAKELGRGSHHVCKDRLNSLGISSKSINGLTISQFREAFGKEPAFLIETKAGPSGGISKSSFWKIIPWVYLKLMIDHGEIETDSVMKKLIYAMADFQNWIFEGNAEIGILLLASFCELRIGVKK